MIPENITKLVERLAGQSRMVGFEQAQTIVENPDSILVKEAEKTRQALLDAIEAALSKPAVPEDIGKLIDDCCGEAWRRGFHQASLRPDNLPARRNLEAAIAALANRAGGGVKVKEAADRLRENLAYFDNEVATELSAEGERADLWGEIDVNVEDLRTILASAPVNDEHLSKSESAPVAPGWKLVPIEPTLEMLDAGNRASRNVRMTGVSGMTIDAQTRNQCAREAAAWEAMLAAAPTPDSNGTEGGEKL